MINIHISGPQGCGKTRLEKLLAAFIVHSCGTVITEEPFDFSPTDELRNRQRLRDFFDGKTVKITSDPEAHLHMYLGADA